MNKQNIMKGILGVAGAASMILGFAGSAGAETNLNAGLKANLPNIVLKGDASLQARSEALDKLSIRFDDKNMSDEDKARIHADIQVEKQKLNDLRENRSDDKKIDSELRHFSHIIPRGYIFASVNRTENIGKMMLAVQAKLQVRIDAAKAEGKNVAAIQASNSDISVQVAAAKAAVVSAKAKVASLAQANGNATIEASNKAALVSARADLKVAKDDLTKARADIKVVMQGLKELK